MIYTFAIVTIALLLAFVYPYFIYPRTLLFMPARAIECREHDPAVRFSLLFSAYNEEGSLPQKIANLRALRSADPTLEIIAYCDLSTDRTLEILRGASDVLEVIAAESRTGKAAGMARMVARARGDVCIFTDANVILDPEGLTALRRYFSDPEVGGVAGSLIYINEDESATARAGGAYWRLEEIIKSRESACGSVMGADGSIFAVRRELYPPVPPHLLDDMIVSMSAVLAGKRLVHAPDVVAYERSATRTSEEFARKRRIACRAFNTHRHLWPQIRQRFGAAGIYKYAAHKVLRWFGLPILLGALVAASATVLLAGLWPVLLAAVCASLVCVALALAGVRPFATAIEVFLAITATFLGILDALKGRTYQTWSPALSRDARERGCPSGEPQSQIV